MKHKKQLYIGLILLGVLLVAGGLFVGKYGFDRLSKEDCTSLEKFDSLRGECYFECETDAQCEEIAKKVEAELDAYFKDSKSAVGTNKPTAPAPEAPSQTDTSQQDKPQKTYTADETGSEVRGKIYTVTSSQALYPTPSSEDQKLWELFTRIASKQVIAERLETFEVFNDGNNDTAASVWESSKAGKWHMNVNSAFSGERKDLIHTMVHEFGHILTLNSSQVDKTEGACPQITVPEGCVKPGTILNDFHAKFWSKYGEPFSEDGQEVSAPFSEDDFVSEYAASNVIEDLAETFANFVLRPAPSGGSIRDQKIQLFYASPEYVNVRNRIRANLASEL